MWLCSSLWFPLTDLSRAVEEKSDRHADRCYYTRKGLSLCWTFECYLANPSCLPVCPPSHLSCALHLHVLSPS
ncbi:latrophilin 3, isoform CRA_i [Rattus norvegicus]|uniref:Latrophilin 3, isoform CRA_i n=1 Tax=Rattus norvegicus TaxID=10116 RepID=A6JCU2_RAT|nr:latrophilin 3, isoform CRA_i [Rattus norvegicus]